MKTFVEWLENIDNDYEDYLTKTRKEVQADPKYSLARARLASTSNWQHPNIMYHTSYPENRDSIMKFGLDPKFAKDVASMGERGVYLANYNPVEDITQDLWQVNVRGLKIEMDPNDVTFDHWGDTWPKKSPKRRHVYHWVSYNKIPPHRLKLIQKGISSA